MTSPVTSMLPYRNRAANRPKPRDYIEQFDPHFHTDVDHAFEAMVTSARSFWADISEYQSPVDSRYPYQQLACRLDTGYRLDYNAKTNVTNWHKLKRSGFLSGYIVFIPGESKNILSRIQNAFGKQLEGIAPMDDMESGSGFAGGGNHSSEANDLAYTLADITGSKPRQIGYANGGDWANCWSLRPPWMKRIIASYGSIVPSGYWAHQFHGGGDYPVPPGYPRSCAPWGSYIDLNSAPGTTSDLMAALELGEEMAITDDQVNQILLGIKFLKEAVGNAKDFPGLLLNGDDTHPANLKAMQQQIKDLQAAVNKLAPGSVSAAPTYDAHVVLTPKEQ